MWGKMSGKSETALELIHRGLSCESDDFVKFSESPTGDIIGKSTECHILWKFETGIIDIKTLYGMQAFRIHWWI